ncbi:hypothetical protein [Candidatus Nitrosocosmicus sp. FF01]|uniref:hypothetical protein n=1 Tax=Candidatus Nitrosocosmicus sp. FF01 TaxID=3397670 RepID=UPI0039E981BD
MTVKGKIQRISIKKDEEIIQDLIQYLLNNCVIYDSKRGISCNLIERSMDGTNVITIKKELFKDTKQIQEWIRSTEQYTVMICFRKALEEVYGLEFANKVKIVTIT